MNSAPQETGVNTNLSQHSCGDLCVNWFAAMGATSERDLFLGETKTIRSTGSTNRNRLEGFSRGTEKGNRIGKAGIRGEQSIAGHYCNVPSMTRLSNCAASNFD